MENKSYTTVDKSTWGDGPWQDEPDKKQWMDEETGLPCLIVRGPVGALCGYVGVPKSHPAYRLNYNGCNVKRAARNMRQSRKAMRRSMREKKTGLDGLRVYGRSTTHYEPKKGVGEEIANISVHGGLTFSDKCQPKSCESEGICHTVSPGEDDNIWWYGFDCAHHRDVCPAYPEELRYFREGTYKDEAYVTAEIQSLAKQLKTIERNQS